MPDFSLRSYVPSMILAAGCLLLYQGTREQVSLAPAAPLAGILSNLDGYRIEEQRVGDEERRIAGMSDYVARIYWRDTTVAFTTYVGYYDRQTQGKSIHSPRNCLPGAGWEILRAGTATVQSATGPHVVNRYLLKNRGLQAVVYYWYQGRGRVVANEYAVKVNLLRDAALLGHTEEALVRIVIPFDPGAPGTATNGEDYARAEALGAELAPRMIDEVQRVLPSPEGSARVASALAGEPR
jgi:EpsI family protein